MRNCAMTPHLLCFASQLLCAYWTNKPLQALNIEGAIAILSGVLWEFGAYVVLCIRGARHDIRVLQHT